MAKIIEGDNICSITIEEIKENDYYMTCRKCHKNYKSDPLKLWLQRENSCPTCRIPWITKDNLEYEVLRNCEPKKDVSRLSYLLKMTKIIEQFSSKIGLNLKGYSNKMEKKAMRGDFDEALNKLYEKYNVGKNNIYFELVNSIVGSAINYYTKKPHETHNII